MSRRSILLLVGLCVRAGTLWVVLQSIDARETFRVLGRADALGTAIPSAPGFVGTFELAAAGMATALGVPGAEALALAVVAHVMTLVPLALGGAASVLLLGANLGEVAKTAETHRHG